MLTLSLAMRAAGDEGEPLPCVFPQLEAIKAKPRRGAITMVCAAPGGGKSAWMSEYIINVQHETGEKVKGMYFSADTDRMTLGKRAAAGIIGSTTEEAEEWLKTNEQDIWHRMEEATEHIWMCFDAGLTIQDIEDEVKAYAYVTGEWPEIIVVDVLMNVQGSATSGDHVAYAETMEWLHMLARETQAAIFVLHHVTGQWEDGDTPIPLSGVLGKVTKFARLILTLYRPYEGAMGVCVVKNSSGPMDPTASNPELRPVVPWYPERSWFGRDEESIKAIATRRIADSIKNMSTQDDDDDEWTPWRNFSVA